MTLYLARIAAKKSGVRIPCTETGKNTANNLWTIPANNADNLITTSQKNSATSQSTRHAQVSPQFSTDGNLSKNRTNIAFFRVVPSVHTPNNISSYI